MAEPIENKKKERCLYIISFLSVVLIYSLYILLEIEKSQPTVENLAGSTACEDFNVLNRIACNSLININDPLKKEDEQKIKQPTDTSNICTDSKNKDICDRIATLQINIDALPNTIKNKLHHHEIALLPWVQFLAVIFLTALCFFTFFAFPTKTKSYKKYIAYIFSLLCALGFAIMMMGEYQPAVFVMAMVAIAVAGEHWATLENFREESEKFLEKIETKTDKVLNTFGISLWKDNLYKKWLLAQNRIDGIFRIFDIDEQWWQVSNQNIPISERWKQYEECNDSKVMTLYRALFENKCNPKVLIVTDLPMPSTYEWENLKKGNMFETIFGLIWQLTVFSKVVDTRKKHPKKNEIPYLRIFTSCPPIWMHVIDENVLVAIDRGNTNSAARSESSGKDKSVFFTLTEEGFLFESSDGSEAKISDSNASISQWAFKDIRRYAARGTLAEEYLFSVIRYLFLARPDYSYGEEQILSDKNIQTIVFDDLGFDKWWSSNKQFFEALKLEQDCVKGICAAVFVEFLNNRIKNEKVVNNNVSEELCLEHFDREVL